MATTPVEFRAPTGLTITVKLYPYGSDSIANGVSGDTATEATNRKGLYTISVTEALTGWHTLHYEVSGIVLDVLDAYMVDSTDIVRAHHRSDLGSTGLDELETSINAIGVNVTVAPLQATAPQRVNGTTITYFVGEVTSQTIAITDANDTAVDLSGITPQIVIESRQNRADIQTVTPSVSGESNNQITFTNNTSVTKTVRELYWSLRDTSDGKVYAHGIVDVKYATGADS